MFRHCGTNKRAPQWTFTDPCKPDVNPGARDKYKKMSQHAKRLKKHHFRNCFTTSMKTGNLLSVEVKKNLITRGQ